MHNLFTTDGAGEVTVPSALPLQPPTVASAATATDAFVQDSFGVRVDWDKDDAKRLRHRLDLSKKGDITLRSYITGGKLGKREIVVLKRNRDQTFRYNEADGPLVKAAVSDTKAVIDKLVKEARAHNETAEGMEMVDISHVYKPYHSLSDQENRENAGVLNPPPPSTNGQERFS